MEKYCEEIEFKTRSAKIGIHIQWKSDEVNFHVAGLQEGVTKAMQFIQKEFLPPEVNVLLLHHIHKHVLLTAQRVQVHGLYCLYGLSVFPSYLFIS